MGLHWTDILLVFIPFTFILNFMGADSTIIFISSILAILPIAAKMGEATEELARIFGGQIGGLLNATFGNAAELIIALIAISKGLEDLVKASLAGAIIGNLLFVFGASIFISGLKYKEQKFSSSLAGLNSTMLLIAFMSMMIPSMFHFVPTEHRGNDELLLSLGVSILLIGLYLLSMIFSLKTHNYLFRGKETETGSPGNPERLHGKQEAEEKPKWSRNVAIGILLLSTAFLALISEIFVAQVEKVALNFGLSELFIGAVIVAIVGNAAEHLAAIFFALKNDVDLAIGVTIGSSLQVAMFVAPIAVIAGFLMHKPMDLVFTPFEIIAVFASVLIINEISTDGKCNWFEGAQLLVMYLIIAALFFFVR